MKKVFIVGLASICFGLTMAPESLSASTARVVWATNTVQITRGGRWVSAYNGTPVNSGAYVRTGSNSRAQIHYADGSVMRLGSRSVARVRYVQSKSVSLKKGKAYFKVAPQRKRMKVRTRTAVATVLGTEFVVEIKEGQQNQALNQMEFGYGTQPEMYAQVPGGEITQITTLSGLVGVSGPEGGNPIELGPGMTTFISENMPPQPPQQASPEQMKENEDLLKEEPKDPDQGPKPKGFANKPLDPGNPQQRTTVQQNSPGEGGGLDTTPTTGNLEVIIK